MTDPVTAAERTVPVRLLHFPIDLQAESTEHFDGLKREFALLAIRTPESAEVPKRLLELIDALTEQYAGMTDSTDRLRDDAAERGETVIDELVYEVPADVAAACIDLAVILDEADEFCRAGEVLLTLSTPTHLVAFRRWYLGEFVAQINGEPALAWSEVDQAALIATPTLRGAGG